MKYAHIVPLKNFKVGESVNDMHLLLYHWAKQSREYREKYRNSKIYKILDNSFYELRHEIDYDDLIKIAEILKVDEIVAPDIMYDYKKTRKLIEEFLPLVPKKFKVQAVVCGSTLKELLECFTWMNYNKEIDVIAISKHGQKGMFSMDTNFYITRQKFYNLVKPIATKPIHFLGLNNVDDLFTMGIRSIDSKWLAKFASGKRKIRYDSVGVDNNKLHILGKFIKCHLKP